MREILFRGKRVDNSEWVYGAFPLSSCIYVGCEASTAIYDGKRFYEVTPETIGQFTGFTDENGVKIFERDIVKFKNEDGDGVEQTSIVKWESGGLVVTGDFGDYDITNIGWAIEDLGDCEIIGNTYDNPELIKQ